MSNSDRPMNTQELIWAIFYMVFGSILLCLPALTIFGMPIYMMIVSH